MDINKLRKTLNDLIKKNKLNKNDEDLLPCPFCGSDDLEYEFSSSQGFIKCNQCDCMGPHDQKAADPHCSIDAARNIWNIRQKL